MDNTNSASINTNQQLTNDKYYPGLIDDAVNRKKDFNKISFELCFGDKGVPVEKPKNTPLSLIEAFDMRSEQYAQNKIQHKNIEQDCTQNLPENLRKKSFISFLEDVTGAAVHQKLISRDEILLANTVGVDISFSIRSKPINEIDEALHCLQKAELMNSYDSSLQVAEEAYKKAPLELAESAAVYGVERFTTQCVKETHTTINEEPNYKPIEIVSYLGITKPSPDAF